MNENGLSAADVAAVTGGYGNRDGFFGGDGMFLFAILALMWGGGGFFGGNRGNCNCATVEDLNNTSNFARLENQVQGIGQSISQQGTNIYNGICNLGYETLKNFNTLQAQVADCCCTMKSAIDNLRFDMTTQNAATNANFTAQIQSVKDMFSNYEREQLKEKVNYLQMKDFFCGVPKFQPAQVYGSIPFGFGFNNGCNGCNGCNGYWNNCGNI